MQCTHTGTHTRVCSVSWPAFEELCHFNCPHHVLIANCAVVLWRNRVVIRHYLLFVCVCGGGCMECRIASKFTNKCHRIHKCILRFTYKCQAILKRFIYRLTNVHLQTARHLWTFLHLFVDFWDFPDAAWFSKAFFPKGYSLQLCQMSTMSSYKFKFKLKLFSTLPHIVWTIPFMHKCTFVSL